jgi:hypothetical protein
MNTDHIITNQLVRVLLLYLDRNLEEVRKSSGVGKAWGWKAELGLEVYCSAL